MPKEDIEERDLLHHVADLEIGSRHQERLDSFYSRYRKELTRCGYNDHMLFKAWWICFSDSYLDKGPEKTIIRENSKRNSDKAN